MIPSGEPAASEPVHPLIDLPFRLAGAALGGSAAWNWLTGEGFGYSDPVESRWVLLIAMAGIVGGWILAPYFSSRPYVAVLAWLRARGPYPLFAGALGALVGLMLALLFAALLPAEPWLPIGLAVLFAPLGAIAFSGHPAMMASLWRSLDRSARRLARSTGKPRLPALRAAPLRRRRR